MPSTRATLNRSACSRSSITVSFSPRWTGHFTVCRSLALGQHDSFGPPSPPEGLAQGDSVRPVFIAVAPTAAPARAVSANQLAETFRIPVIGHLQTLVGP